MAATVEGAFVLIDRASPTLRKIRREARDTDAALKSMGGSLDHVGSSKQLRGLDQTSRGIKNIGRAARDLRTDARNARRDVEGLGSGFTRLHNITTRVHNAFTDFGNFFRRDGGMIRSARTWFTNLTTALGPLSRELSGVSSAIGGVIGGIGGFVGEFPKMIGLVAVAIPVIVTLAGAIGGLASSLGAAVTGGVLGGAGLLGAFAVGLGTVGATAITAWKNITQLKTDLQKLNAEWTKMSRPAQYQFFALAERGFKTLHRLMPLFAQEALKNTSAVRNAFDQILGPGLESKGFRNMIKQLGGIFRAVLPGFAKGIRSTGQAFGALIKAIGPLLRGAGKGFAQMMGQIRDFFRSPIGKQFAQNMVKAFGSWFHLLGGVAKVLGAIMNAAADPRSGIPQLLKSWTDWLNSTAMDIFQHPEKVGDFFKKSLSGAGEFIDTIKSLYDVLKDLIPVLQDLTSALNGLAGVNIGGQSILATGLEAYAAVKIGKAGLGGIRGARGGASKAGDWMSSRIPTRGRGGGRGGGGPRGGTPVKPSDLPPEWRPPSEAAPRTSRIPRMRDISPRVSRAVPLQRPRVTPLPRGRAARARAVGREGPMPLDMKGGAIFAALNLLLASQAGEDVFGMSGAAASAFDPTALPGFGASISNSLLGTHLPTPRGLAERWSEQARNIVMGNKLDAPMSEQVAMHTHGSVPFGFIGKMLKKRRIGGTPEQAAAMATSLYAGKHLAAGKGPVGGWMQPVLGGRKGQPTQGLGLGDLNKSLDDLPRKSKRSADKTSANFKTLANKSKGPLNQTKQGVKSLGDVVTNQANRVKTAATTGFQAAWRAIQGFLTNVGGAHLGKRPGGGKKAAGGMRIPGVGLNDSVPLGGGVIGAPGELVVNRHTEGRVDRALRAHGTSLSREVGHESRPHNLPKGKDDGGLILPGLKKGGRVAPAAAAGPAAPAGGGGGLQAMVNEANMLDSKHLPYVWGGGHGGFGGGGGLDCSGAVSDVLHAGGYLSAPMTSGSLAHWGAAGPGAVTVYANAEHTFMKMNGRYFGTSRTNPGGGAGWINGGMDAGYLHGFQQRHPTALPTGAGAAAGTATVGGKKKGKKGGPAQPGQAPAAGNQFASMTGTLSQGQLVQLAQAAHMPNPQLMAHVAEAESGGRVGVVNSIGATGLWQIYNHPELVRKYGPMTNAWNNAQGAADLLRTQGIGAWAASRGAWGRFAETGMRIPWFGGGGDFIADKPQLIGVGDKRERVTITPAGGGGSRAGKHSVHIGAIHVENHRSGDVKRQIKKEVADAFDELSHELDYQPMVEEHGP